MREGERTAFLESIKERIRDRLAEYGLKPYVEDASRALRVFTGKCMSTARPLTRYTMYMPSG